MISLNEFLRDLRQHGVQLWLEGDRLRYRAAKELLTPALLAELRARKPEIVTFLQSLDRSEPIRRILPQSRTEAIPLSFAQQSLWLLNQFEPDQATYNIPLAYRLTGNLNRVALAQSLTAIVQRHEILRTAIQTIEGIPRQQISAQIKLPLVTIDLTELPMTEREPAAQRHAERIVQQPFDLAQVPLFRLALLLVQPGEQILLFTIHHIIGDGWSSEVFFREFATFYTAFVTDQIPNLPDLPIQYADYAHWQRQALAGEELASQLAYWQKQLAGKLPILQIPTDRPRPAVQSFRGAVCRRMLPEALNLELRSLSQRLGVTLSMLLLTAFKVLLYRYSGQTDIIVGSPIAGRQQAETEGLFGLFINILALRSDLSGDPSFEELLLRVRDVCLAADANQNVPFEKIVETIQPERDASHSPVFQVMFGMNPPWSDGATRELPDLKMTYGFGYVHTAASTFDLTLVMRDTGQGLRASIEYSLDLFNQSTIERTIGQFQTLLESIAASPNQPISALSLLSAAERHQLLNEWNQTQVDYPTACLHELIEAQCQKNPEQIAVLAGERHLTYRDLNQRANQLAYALQEHGVRADVPVALYVERSLEFAIGILGILKAGGAYIPIDLTLPAERRLSILQDAQPPVILTQAHLVSAGLADCEAELICLDADWAQIAQQPTHNLSCQTVPDSLAYIIYTSGSTGTPKGVGITHRGVVNHGLASASLFELTTADRVLQFSNISFDICVEEIFPTWLSGARLILRSEAAASSIAEFLKCMTQSQVTVANLPTAFWHEWVNALSTRHHVFPESLRLVVVGGEKAAYASYKTWASQVGRSPRWLNTYGPTEATVTATVYDPSINSDLLEAHTELPIGRPISNVQAYILDANLQPLPIGVPGELFIGGAGLARGYLNRPDLTAERFLPNPFQPEARIYRTGDLARYWPDGNIEFLNRVDHQVKLRGFRIELGEIEAVIAEYPAVQQAVVTVQANSSRGSHLVAYLVADLSLAALKLDSLRAFLQERLPAYMLPGEFVWLEAIPLTPNGKTDYRALPIPAQPDLTHASSECRDQLECQLAQIWQELLGVPSIGMTDNFFELGGHSLLAVRLFTLIEQQFDRSLPLATLLKAQTLQQLADVLRQEQQPDDWAPLVVIKPDGSRPPLFCIHGGGFNVLVYRNLALRLSPDQPVYGLQAQGLNGRGGVGSNSIEDIAADYINEIRTVRPHGPYALAGLSNGGNIALEMAYQLTAQGEDVRFLGLFDTHAPGGIQLLPAFPRFLSALWYVLWNSIPRWFVKLQQLEPNVWQFELQKLMKSLRRDDHLIQLIYVLKSRSTEQPVPEQKANQSTALSSLAAQESFIERWMNHFSRYVLRHSPWSFFTPSAQLKASDDKVAKTLKTLERSHQKLHEAYAPKSYRGKITIFRAQETPPGYRVAPDLGWSRITEGEVETYRIPGHHVSIMDSLDLAEKLEGCLQKTLDPSYLS